MTQEPTRGAQEVGRRENLCFKMDRILSRANDCAEETISLLRKCLTFILVGWLVIFNLVTLPHFYVPEGIFIVTFPLAIVFSVMSLGTRGFLIHELARGLWISVALMFLVETIFSLPSILGLLYN